MIHILLFFLLFFVPGALFLWLIYPADMLRLELHPGGSIWLMVPTSFAISLSLISVLGWAGYYLNWGFYDVRGLFIAILVFLILASIIKLWKKQPNIKKESPIFRVNKHIFKSVEFAILAFIVVVLMLAIYGGAWFSHTADSFNHMSAIRSLINFDNPLPMQIYWPAQVSGMDPTFGTWHLALAIWASISSLELTTVWLIATIILAPIIVLSHIVLADHIIQNKQAAFISTLLYVIVGLSGDFRQIAQSNRMGQIIFWLAMVYLILAIKSFTQKKNNAGAIFTFLSAWFAWTSSTIHTQYGPIFFGLLFPALLIPVIIRWIEKYLNGRYINEIEASVQKVIAGASLIILLSALYSFAIRSSYTISEKYPMLSQSLQAYNQMSSIALIAEDINNWFISWNSYITIASLTSLLLVGLYFNKNIRVYLILMGVVLLPLYVVLTTLFIGRGGLIFTILSRIRLLIPALLFIGWGWFIAISYEYISQHLFKNKQSNKSILMFFIVIAFISITSIYERVSDPNGGILSIYMPDSEYRWRIATSRDMSVLNTRKDAIHAIESIPGEQRILADEGVGYEMAGVTGKLFVRLPSQHTPLQEKVINTSIVQDTQELFSGTLNNSQMVDTLLRNQVSYIYIDYERYYGQILWDQLDSLAILDEIASGENWRLYSVLSDNVKAYKTLDEKIRNTENFLEKIYLYQQLEYFVPDHDRYQRILTNVFSIDPSMAVDFVREVRDFQTAIDAGVTYNFLNNLNDATVVSEESNPVQRTAYIIKGDPHGVIFQHPTSQLIYSVDIPQNSQLDFSIALDPAVWEVGKGDGVEFIITIEHSYQKRLIFKEYIDPKNVNRDRRWLYYSIDLSDYGGKKVKIIFETRPGFYNNTRFDWAGWGEPRIRYKEVNDLLRSWETLTIENAQNVEIKKMILKLDGDKRHFLFQHPESRISTQVYVPLNSELHFGLGMDPEVWETRKSDGIQYRVYVQNSQSPNIKHLIFDQYLNPNNLSLDIAWQDVVLDLSKFGGQSVEFTFETLPGPNNDDAFDWGGWSSPFIVEK